MFSQPGIQTEHYDAARVLLFDPIPPNLQLTRSILYTMGYRTFEPVTDITKLRATLDLTHFDLFLLECSTHTSELTALIKDLRYGDLGPNPYLVIVCTTWTLSDDLVRDIVNSGADDLVIRPFSTRDLGRRLKFHIESRKRFVVTSDYVGPDRRKGSRSATDDNLIDVPNSLRDKVKNEFTSEAEIAAAIEATKAAITLEKMRRQAFQIGILAKLLNDDTVELVTEAHESERLELDLKKLAVMTEDLDKRVIETEFAHASDLCTSLLKVARNMVEDHKNGRALNAKDLALLDKLSTGLQLAFNPGQDEAKITADIAAVISRRTLRQAS